MIPTARQRAVMRQLAGIYYSAGRNTLPVRARWSPAVELRRIAWLRASVGRDRLRVNDGQ